MSDTLNSAQQSRREFLEKAGKLAVYTPPVIMMLSYPSTEAIASGNPPPDKPRHGHRGGYRHGPGPGIGPDPELELYR